MFSVRGTASRERDARSTFTEKILRSKAALEDERKPGSELVVPVLEDPRLDHDSQMA